MKQKIVKAGRNDPCPCGSGKKYKKCCAANQKKAKFDIAGEYYKRYGIRTKNLKDVEGIKRAGRLVIETLDMVEKEIRPGITTDDINTLVHEFTINNNAVPACLNYKGFPKSVCASVNEVICHGIPSDRTLEDGDIINIDVTSILDRYFADANKTFFVGTPGPEAKKIVSVAGGSLLAALSVVKPGNRIGDIGWPIQDFAESRGCSVVREFVGHGVGFELHEPPQVPHFGRKGEGIELIPGMVFTIEPMINIGKRNLHVLDDHWTAVTVDKSLSAQFEQTVLVTETGYNSLTPYDIVSIV